MKKPEYSKENYVIFSLSSLPIKKKAKRFAGIEANQVFVEKVANIAERGIDINSSSKATKSNLPHEVFEEDILR